MTFKLQIAHVHATDGSVFPSKDSLFIQKDLRKSKETFSDTEERGHRSCKSYEIILQAEK